MLDAVRAGPQPALLCGSGGVAPRTTMPDQPHWATQTPQRPASCRAMAHCAQAKAATPPGRYELNKAQVVAGIFAFTGGLLHQKAHTHQAQHHPIRAKASEFPFRLADPGHRQALACGWDGKWENDSWFMAAICRSQP